MSPQYLVSCKKSFSAASDSDNSSYQRETKRALNCRFRL